MQRETRRAGEGKQGLTYCYRTTRRRRLCLPCFLFSNRRFLSACIDGGNGRKGREEGEWEPATADEGASDFGPPFLRSGTATRIKPQQSSSRDARMCEPVVSAHPSTLDGSSRRGGRHCPGSRRQCSATFPSFLSPSPSSFVQCKQDDSSRDYHRFSLLSGGCVRLCLSVCAALSCD